MLLEPWFVILSIVLAVLVIAVVLGLRVRRARHLRCGGHVLAGGRLAAARTSETLLSVAALLVAVGVIVNWRFAYLDTVPQLFGYDMAHDLRDDGSLAATRTWHLGRLAAQRPARHHAR